jgi:quercetin dioxygenase-like cupin family protein
VTPSHVRRIVTGHEPGGRAVVRSDDLVPAKPTPGGDAGFALLWATLSVPADNDQEIDGAEADVGLAIDAGTVLRIVDFAPGALSPMHRTNSVDYGIVVWGEIELLLDDGSVTRVGPGEVVVQRGTIHAWRNPSADTMCRVAFVLVGASPATVAGQPLEPIDV